MRKLSVLGVSIISLGLLSCTAKYANTPTATNFETTNQQVLQAAHHWNVIGERVTKNVTNALKSKVAKNERILIKQENSAFGKQLHLSLAQALTSNGYRVVKNHSAYDMQKKDYDVLIEPKVQLVKFTRGSQARQIGLPSAIVTGLWGLESLQHTPYGATPLGVATAGVFSYDIWEWFNSNLAGGAPKSEILIDVITSRKDEYVAINKDTYYVVDSDVELYRALDDAVIKEFNIVGMRK